MRKEKNGNRMEKENYIENCKWLGTTNHKKENMEALLGHEKYIMWEYERTVEWRADRTWNGSSPHSRMLTEFIYMDNDYVNDGSINK